MKKTYVRVTMRVGGGKVHTFWAEKLGPCHYRKIRSDGDWGLDNVDRRYIGKPADVVREVPAVMNEKYGELEIVK